MINAAEIEPDLRTALPEHLKEHAGNIARLLEGAANGTLRHDKDLRGRFTPDSVGAAALEALAGQRVGPLLSFGADNHIGEVTVGDVAGGNVLKFHVLPVGGDVIRSIIVQGNHNRVFAGGYERLRDAYISPWDVFQRVKLEHFAGRDWLIAKVDDFLRDHDRGYFILEAEAGLGKTAFLAHLVKERDAIHLFAEQARGQEGVAHGLKSLAAQLILTWGLQPYSADNVLPGAAVRPDFLSSLLHEAAQRRDLRRPGERIVLVVDGLDEAGTPPGQNVLGLPRVLPKGVYLLVSHRPVPVALTVEHPKHLERLKAEDDQNLRDMRDYLECAARRPDIARVLHGSGYSDEQFVATLLEKCRGVWIYLHYVVEEIERGRRSPLDLEALPDGVWGYYAEFWRRERGDFLQGQEQDQVRQEWEQTRLPLLSTLGAVREAVPAAFLFELAEIAKGQGLPQSLLDERWRAFLAIETGPERRYRLYHASLSDFLEARVSRQPMNEADRVLTDELASATRLAHRRIADRYLKAWGGLDRGLPGLVEPESRRRDGAYGLRHLAAHLEGGGCASDLHNLLRLERCSVHHVLDPCHGLLGWLDRRLGRPRKRRVQQHEPVWFTALDQDGETALFLGDVARAWHLAEERGGDGKSSGSIGPQCRYALITASINSLAESIPIPLLAALVEKGIWRATKALAYIRQIMDLEARAEALAGLAHLTPAERDRALHEALEAARAIGDARARSRALAGLAPRLAELGRPGEALEAARAIGDKWEQSRALAGLAPHLTPDLLREALEAVQAIGDAGARSRALAGLAPHLTPAERDRALRKALEAAQAIGSEEERSQALAGLAPHLTPDLLREALEAAWAIGDVGARSRALAGLAPRLAELGRPSEALEAAWAIGDAGARSRALAGLAPRLAELGRPSEALEAARAIGDAGARSRALAGLAPHLTPDLLRKALEAARAIGDAGARSRALAGLAPHLTPDLLREALEAARAIGDAGERSRALAGLAPHLTPAERDRALREALEAARAIWDAGERSRALAGLAPRLAELGRPSEALEAAWAIGDAGARSRALAGLAPRLAELGRPSEALEAARAIGDAGARSRALAGLAPHLSAGRAGPPPDARSAPRGAGGGAGDRGRGGAVPGAGRAGPSAGGTGPPE